MELMFKLDFGAGLEGRLLGAGGGEGYGRHKGVIGELITISALLDMEISLFDLCTIDGTYNLNMVSSRRTARVVQSMCRFLQPRGTHSW